MTRRPNSLQTWQCSIKTRSQQALMPLQATLTRSELKTCTKTLLLPLMQRCRLLFQFRIRCLEFYRSLPSAALVCRLSRRSMEERLLKRWRMLRFLQGLRLPNKMPLAQEMMLRCPRKLMRMDRRRMLRCLRLYRSDLQLQASCPS